MTETSQEYIEHPAKLPDYFLWRNKSNINQFMCEMIEDIVSLWTLIHTWDTMNLHDSYGTWLIHMCELMGKSDAYECLFANVTRPIYVFEITYSVCEITEFTRV